MPPAQPPRILIVRLSAIGDCILTTPLIQAIREKYPQAFLAWVVEQPSAALLTGHPGLDELIVVPRGWLKSLKTVRDVRQKLRRHKFDFAIDPQSLTKSAVLSWLSGAKTRIGLAPPEGRELAPWLCNRRIRATRPHIVERSLELLKPLGIEHPKAQFLLPRYADAEPIVAKVQASIEGATDFVLVNVGAGWPAKLWVAERFAKVARHLAERHALRSVVMWAGDEMLEAQRIVADSDGHAVLAPETTLREVVTLARSARLFIACDTGPLHMAAAVGTPCIGLYGPTRPERAGPYGPSHITVEPPHIDTNHGMRDGRGNSAMRAIDARRVCEACDTILQRGQNEDRCTAESPQAA